MLGKGIAMSNQMIYLMYSTVVKLIVLLTALTLVYLVSTENFGVPLGAPFAPFIRRDLRDTFVKYNLLSLKERPTSLSSPNKRRQK